MALSKAGDQVLETGRKEINGWVQSWVHARPALAGLLWKFWEKTAPGTSSNHPVFHSQDSGTRCARKRAISFVDWLAALDDFRNWLIQEAA